tara:strand:- start:1905 stop:2771 length:867 start_codon:yes stop_codon:yes gene_type:complete
MDYKTTLSHRDQEPENGVLYIVATPIGNLSDISFRSINILEKVSLIACEDTRQTKKIMHKFGIENNLISFNKHNSAIKSSQIINKLKENKSIALVSDAGMPTICDPGEELIRHSKTLGIDIICIPGPCAALTALVSSGFTSSSFIFEGFLPRKKIEREKIIIDISTNEKTTVLFESPHRLKQLLGELKKYCGGTREIEIARELTKKFEEHIGPDIDSAIKFFEQKDIKGEFTIVIKGIDNVKNTFFNEKTLQNDLNDLIKAGLTHSAASKYLAKKNKISKRIIYNLSK